MKTFIATLLIWLVLSTNISFSFNHFEFLDPLPNSTHIKKESTIIIKPDRSLNLQSLLNKGAIIIDGTVSGESTYQLLESDDRKTIILKPDKPFALGEKVTVTFNPVIKTNNGKRIKGFSYSFFIETKEIEPALFNSMEIEISSLPSQVSKNNLMTDDPRDFPIITITHNQNPFNASIFLSNIVFNTNIPNTPYIMILDEKASPVFTRQMPAATFNFDRQPNGRYTYMTQGINKFYELDTNYIKTDSFYCGNGYITDVHELRVLANRHAFLLSYDKRIVNMSLIVSGGNPNAMVTGLIIQEIDANKNVVFQWRSWDHFLITDATHENLLAGIIDYVHGNALEIDNDDNILLSSRHMDEITKINRTNGNIIWRLGGKNNQFTFINDAIGFSHQHAIRRISNGNITLYDNGNYHTPKFSRAVEYSLDEVNKTATLVWQYRNTPDIYGSALGFVQRLPNGNTLISWGATNPTLTELKPDNTKVFQMTFSQDVFSYRGFKYNLNILPVGTPNPSSTVSTYSLSQNYPNPFNPVTKIDFAIPKKGYVKLTVFDEIGREVIALVNSELGPGKYEVTWNASGYPSGVYYYKLSATGGAGDYVETKKMVLIK